MHPMIKPALRRSWRSGQTVQYGVAPAHAVQFGPVDHATGSFLDILDGTRNLTQLREAAQALGLGARLVDRLLERLLGAGVLDDATIDRATAARIDERMGPDLASLSLLHHEPGGALRRITRRRASRVQVRGGGRVGAALAGLLSAGGVGQVEARDGGCVTPDDASPGGVGAEQTGERRATALRKVIRRATPWSRAPRQRAEEQRGLDLVVIAPREGVSAYAPRPESARELIAAGQPHLYAGVVEGTGFVGPLVLPGASSCAECMMLARTEREPAWPLIVGQWRSARGRGPAACDTALATVIAAAAANAAFRFLDGDSTDTVGTRVSYVLPNLWREEEELPAHTGCPCGAAAVTEGFPDPASPPSDSAFPRFPRPQR